MANWKHTLDVSDIFHADVPFTQIRDTIAERIKNDNFVKFRLTQDFNGKETITPLGIIVQRISESEDENVFDKYWDLFYNWCDINRVWVKTF